MEHRFRQGDATVSVSAQVPLRASGRPDLPAQDLPRGLHPRRAARSRRIVWALAERDLRARYKQSLLGFAWASHHAARPDDGLHARCSEAGAQDRHRGVAVPAVRLHRALLPWTFFSSSVSSGGTSLVSNAAAQQGLRAPRGVPDLRHPRLGRQRAAAPRSRSPCCSPIDGSGPRPRRTGPSR